MKYQLNLNTENVPFGVILYNYDGFIIDANKRVERILKIDTDQMRGKRWDDLPLKFINKDGVELRISKHPLIETLRNGKDVVDEVIGVVLLLSRTVIWVNLSVLCEPFNQANTSGERQMIMYLSDVTDIVKVSITTEDIIEKINLGSWQWDILTGGAIFSNQWAEMLGYTLDELSPIDIDVWRRLVHPDDMKIYERLLQKHFNRDAPHCEAIMRMKHKDGHWVWIRDIGKVTQWSENKEPLYMAGIHQDISNFKNNELHLSEKIEYGKILNDISNKFINTDDIDATIIESFAKLASLTHASRVYLFRFDSEKQTMSNTHEWCNKGVSPQKDILQDLPMSTFPWWIEKLSNGEIIDISDVSKMDVKAKAEKKILEEQNVKSIFVLPVVIKHSLVGFIGFDNVLSSKNWSIDDIDFLSTTVSVFSYALDRQFSEQELNKSYLNLRAYFDSNSDFIFVFNKEGKVIEVNKQVNEKLGYKDADIVGKHVLKLHPSNVWDEAARVFDAMLQNKTRFCSLPLITQNGDQLLVETYVSKGFWNGEEVFFGISKDVSEKVLSLEKYEKIFQNIPTMAGLIDATTGKYIEVNKVFTEKLGYTYDEVINTPAVDLLKVDANSYQQLLSEITEDGYIDDFETVFYHKDGTAFDVLTFATSISLLDEKYVLTLATDVSQNKRNERELFTAKNKAEESDKLKSAFLATMSHELRTPLNHIIGFSSMLPDMTEDESIKDFSQLIYKSGVNLLNIIEDVFDLAMMDQSKINLREEDIYIRDIYLELKKVLQETVSDSDKSNPIRLEFNIDSNIVTRKIVTDKSKIMQVVSNLIKNAVKFTHRGVISLDIKIENDDNLSIAVKDTGIGIPEDKQDIIFQFFRQADDSHTRKYEGIGIGLAISQKIADAMGGSISLKSALGIGSQFKFCFPIKFYSNQLIDEEEIINTMAIPDLSNKKILIAEDDLIGMRMLENMLLPTECEIIKATNGIEALQKIFEYPSIGLVLMDLKMPVMDGFDATMQIRQQSPLLPIIALTAYSLKKDKEKAIQAGCNYILTKPVNKEMLFKKLKDFLL